MDADYDLLCTRTLQSSGKNLAEKKWRSCPLIVSNNNVKDALNAHGAAAFAAQTNQRVHWYYLRDKHSGKTITDPALQQKLEGLHSGTTKQRLTKIPLVLGMPVMIAQNFDVQGGVVNGSQGILKKIRYTYDNVGNRILHSCIVELPQPENNQSPTPQRPMQHLPPNHIPILPDTTDMTFVHPFSRKQCLIERTQVPILPAFAMTAHKAQGQSLPNVIIDLQSCRGTESPYVMVSRVTSLDGLLILRNFG